MKKLLYKEIRLGMHPTNPLFLGLSAMLLIPNYPYYVIFSTPPWRCFSPVSPPGKITTWNIPCCCRWTRPIW